METEKKLNKSQFLRNAVADVRLFAEGAAAIYIAVVRENLEKQTEDPINWVLLAAGLGVTVRAITRRLPTPPVNKYGGNR